MQNNSFLSQSVLRQMREKRFGMYITV